MLARGSLISALVILFLLPAILVTFEPLMARTSRFWRTAKPQRTAKTAVLPDGRTALSAPSGEAQPEEAPAKTGETH